MSDVSFNSTVDSNNNNSNELNNNSINNNSINNNSINNNSNNTNELNNNSKKKRSWVWQYFVVEDDQKAKCSVCGLKVRYVAASTTNLIHHLESTHRLSKNSANKRCKYDELVFDDESDNENSDEVDEESSKLSENRVKLLNRSLINFIVHTNQPISIVENSSFKEFVNSLSSQYKVPCRNNLRMNLIPAMV
jgi:hypothetical protein